MNYSTKPMFVYFSRLLDKPVVDRSGSLIAEVYDIVVRPSEVYPQSSHLIVRKGFPNRKFAIIGWEDVLEVDDDENAVLKIEEDKITWREKHNNKEELTLRRDVLDQQVVDTYNHKVIRVNDIHLLRVDNSFMIAHVDISMRGLFRRLGYERFIDGLVKFFNKEAHYLKKEPLISWKYIQPLSVNPVSKTIKINVPHKQLDNIPAADLGEIFLDLAPQAQITLFKSLDGIARAKVFRHVDFKTQKALAEQLPLKDAVEVLNSIPSDDATDFLEKLPKDKTGDYLEIMESRQSKKLSQLLGYSSDSAGGLMIAEYLAFFKDSSVESVLRQIRQKHFKVEPAQFVYIIDEAGRLVGSTNFRRLISSDPHELLSKTAFPKTYFVHLDSGVKEVAYLMEKYKYYAIPVVDNDNILQGIITVDDVLSQLIALAWRRLKKIKAKPTPAQ